MGIESQKAALFLDRDGVINEDTGYLCDKDACQFLPGIFALVERANAFGMPVIVVTNQSGIARGLFSEQAFLDFSAWMKDEFLRHGARIDAIYYCPHHPDKGQGKYLVDCDCRKPASGLFHSAAAEMDINLQTSIMVGDKLRDIEASLGAGVGRNYLLTQDDQATEGKANHYTVISHLQQVRLRRD